MVDPEDKRDELFISYAHKDDKGNPGDDTGTVEAIANAIKTEFLALTVANCVSSLISTLSSHPKIGVPEFSLASRLQK